MAVSAHCIYCDRRWPATPEYQNCPGCREPTKQSFVQADTSDEAAARDKAHLDFGWSLCGRWLEDREAA